MMNDEIRTLIEYGGDGIHYTYHGDKELLESIVFNLNNMQPLRVPI